MKKIISLSFLVLMGVSGHESNAAGEAMTRDFDLRCPVELSSKDLSLFEKAKFPVTNISEGISLKGGVGGSNNFQITAEEHDTLKQVRSSKLNVLASSFKVYSSNISTDRYGNEILFCTYTRERTLSKSQYQFTIQTKLPRR